MLHLRSVIGLFCLALLCIGSEGSNSNVINWKKYNLIDDDTTSELVLAFKQDKKAEERALKPLSVRLGTTLPKPLREKRSKPVLTIAGFSFYYDRQARLDIEHPFPECTRLTWTTTAFNEIRDCISYGSADWFGGPEQYEQLWPVQKLNKTNYPFITKSADNMAVADRYWLSSEGSYIYVDPSIPLFIDSNSADNPNQLCFISRSESPYYDITELILRYTICTFDDVKTAQAHAVKNYLGHASSLPDELMFRHPIWSTWARYKKDINESTVMQFAQEILDNGFNNSQLEIDDDWETCYGELQFNSAKFPNPKGMVDALHQLGFRVTLWVHPFINSNCPLYNTALQQGYFVRNLQNEVKVEWWNGKDAAIIDVTNPAARTWWANRLISLKNQIGLDGYKFDAGEALGFLPQLPFLRNINTQSDYSLAYSNFVNGIINDIGSAVEIRSTYSNQGAPIFLRMIDKDSRWGLNNGLRSVVTTLLQMNVVGYPMVLADMIGGNGYGSDQITPELFIRWLQASTFMPSLQFSYVPWQFNDPSVVEISKKFVDLHYNYSELILQLANDATTGSGLPINRPICFALPNGVVDGNASYVDDEFMLGNNILVAPVMDPNATSRTIYLPEGFWTDMNTGFMINGPITIVDYPAPLDTLPYFRKENIVNSSSNLSPTLILLLASALISSLYFK
ncbi:myogenesis-regulating glycosidase-like [Neocloeon triangulifer]|uniref:myogenesis-regulating glycosidase-like n=1 Tax=Neocloeon triangulifer TaxID=2078957 RepID=UPI00286F6EB7|nr:myogenesis-regulating glycosidase-like [Neocloeon triangulifer]